MSRKKNGLLLCFYVQSNMFEAPHVTTITLITTFLDNANAKQVSGARVEIFLSKHCTLENQHYFLQNKFYASTTLFIVLSNIKFV